MPPGDPEPEEEDPLAEPVRVDPVEPPVELQPVEAEPKRKSARGGRQPGSGRKQGGAELHAHRKAVEARAAARVAARQPVAEDPPVVLSAAEELSLKRKAAAQARWNKEREKKSRVNVVARAAADVPTPADVADVPPGELQIVPLPADSQHAPLALNSDVATRISSGALSTKEESLCERQLCAKLCSKSTKLELENVLKLSTRVLTRFMRIVAFAIVMTRRVRACM